jgi:hypothetical protein
VRQPLNVAAVAAAQADDPFTPADVGATLRLWLDAEDSPITDTGGLVDLIEDLSGNGNDFVSTTTARPSTGVDTQGGRNVLTFTSDYLTSASSLATWTFMHNGSEWAVFAAVSFGTSSNPNAAYGLVGNNGGSANRHGVGVFYDDRASVPRNERVACQVSRNVSAQFTIEALGTDGMVPPQEFGVLSIVTAPSCPLAVGRCVVSFGDNPLNYTNIVTNAASTTDPNLLLQVGAVGNNALAATMKLGTLLVYEGAVSPEDAYRIQRYLTDRWGITEASWQPHYTPRIAEIVNDANHNAFVGFEEASNGDLLIAYRQSTDHAPTAPGDIKLIRSTDAGATWGSAVTVVDESFDVRDVTMLRLKSGRLLLFYFEYPTLPTVRQRCLYSDNDGATWSSKVTVESDLAYWWAASGDAVQLENGDVLCALYGKYLSGDSDTSVRVSRSTDNGATWADVAEVADGVADVESYEEPSLFTYGGDHVGCVMRSGSDTFYLSESDDAGETWSTPAAFGSSGSGRPAVLVLNKIRRTAAMMYRHAASSTAFTVFTDFSSLLGSPFPFLIGLSPSSHVYGQIKRTRYGVAVAFARENATTDANVHFGFLVP